jgi:hypothetical protein
MTALTVPPDLSQAFEVLVLSPGENRRWGLPFTWEGVPGIGKSARIRSMMKALGLPVITILGSIRDPSEFLGLPIPTRNDSGAWEVHNAPSHWSVLANELCLEYGGCVVFLDELKCCTAATQKALLRVVNEGTVGEYQLRTGVRFVMAQNPTEIAVEGRPLSAPLANRTGHGLFPCSVSDFCSFLESDDPDDEFVMSSSGSDLITQIALPDETGLLEPRLEPVRMGWSAAWARNRTLLSHFMQSSQSETGGEKSYHVLIHPPLQAREETPAWPSPRSWLLGLRALTTAQLLGYDDPELILWLLSSFVGVEPANMFLTYLQDNRIPKPAELLEAVAQAIHKPDGHDPAAYHWLWAPDATRSDELQLVLKVATEYVGTIEDDDLRQRHTRAAWQLLRDVAQLHVLDVVLDVTPNLSADNLQAFCSEQDLDWVGEISSEVGESWGAM